MSKATVTIDFSNDVDTKADAFEDKLKAAIEEGLRTEGWERFASVSDISGDNTSKSADEKRTSGSNR